MNLKTTPYQINRRFYLFLHHCLILMASTVGYNSFAQTAGSYGFTQTSGTYTSITGGTVLNASIPDSWVSSAVTLTPGFSFCGTTYTTAFITSNGLITLGGTAPSTTQYNGIANTTGSGIAFSVFNADLRNSNVSGVSSEIRYQLVGDEHVFQWKDASRWASDAVERISFQARFNHVTGVITYVYSNTSVNSATTYQPIVGIRTANTAGNWQSRTVGTGTETWATSLASTATTNTMRFTTSSPAKSPTTGQTYIFTPPLPCTDPSLVFPTTTATSVIASPNSICVSGNVTLNFSTTTALPNATGITYKWQTAPTATGTWVDIPGAVTTLPTYTTTVPVTTSAYYRCLVMCNGTTIKVTSTASNQVLITNPGNPTVTNGSRCGPGSVALSAIPTTGNTINWYAAATGGAPLGTGNNYTTPNLTSTTTFYAAVASGNTTAGNGTLGTGNLTASTNYVNPFYHLWGSGKRQYLILASELQAMGFTGGNLNSLGLDFTAVGVSYNGFAISIAPTTLTALSGMVNASFTPVYTSTAATPTVGVNTYNFNTPFIWDGSSNVLVQMCWGNNNTGGASPTIRYNATPFSSMVAERDDNQTSASICTYTSYYETQLNRPQMYLGYVSGCQGVRQPVVATINPSTPVAKTLPEVICNDAVGAIALTPPTPAYSSYNWSSSLGGDLYNDAAGTSPYTTGSALNMYVRSTTPGVHTIFMMAGNPNITTGCTYADTFRIHVQPSSVIINSLPDTICTSGSAILSLNPISPYYSGSTQWFSSTNNTIYDPIIGATNPTYTTPTLTYGNNTYYKVEIKAGTQLCQAPIKYVVIADPQLVSAADSFNCGPGTVTLKAVTAGNGTAVWYDVPTGGNPIGAGPEFITPYIAATTTYYVSSNAGVTNYTRIVGLGANTSSDYVSPFYYFYGGQKNQYLIRAAELIAAGFQANDEIFSVGLDLTLAGTTMIGLSASLGHTNANALTTNWVTGLQQVRAPANFVTTNGLGVITFDNGFTWDGVSNLVIQFCWSNNDYGGTSINAKIDNTSYVSSSYQRVDVVTPASICSNTAVYGTYSKRPKFTFNTKIVCATNRVPVIASIYPKPVVDLGADINKCIDAGEGIVLDAGVQPNTPQYMWDNGSTSQVRSVFASGAYYATVTNEFTCATTDTVNVTFRPNPVVNLGADTTICEDLEVTLNAGNDGIQYYWNTGATTPTIVVNAAGTYNVFVTNSEGCFKSDTIVVKTEGLAPIIDRINVTNNGDATFHFTAVNPQNVIGYEWDFGDFTPFSYQESPTHTYENPGNYLVRLTLSSTCGFVIDSSSAHILPNGLDDINADQSFTVYPNPTTESATIANQGSLKMEHITVFNVLGQKVISQKAQSATKHQISLHGVASGIYTIQITTDKGNITRKLEIIK